MVRKSKTKKTGSIVIGIGVLLAIVYMIGFGTGTGIWVSCDSHTILGIKQIPPPLMSVAQPKICEVNITVYNMNSTLVCDTREGVFNVERGIIRCKGIKNFKGQELKITATFYDNKGSLMGKDTKNLEFSS